MVGSVLFFEYFVNYQYGILFQDAENMYKLYDNYKHERIKYMNCFS